MKNYHTYLQVTDLEREWGFYVTTVGHKKIAPQGIYPPVSEHPATYAFQWNKGRVLEEYCLIYIGRGQGIFETDELPPTNIHEGTCFFIFPHVWHRYKPNAESGWEEYWIGFNGDYPDKLMNKTFFNKKTPVVQAGLNQLLQLLFNRLLETVQNTNPGYQQMVPGITMEILGLVLCISQHKAELESPTQRLIDKARFLLQESVEKSISVQQLARELPMGYSKFRKEFKKRVGESPHEYHLNLKLDRAKELLLSTRMNINEIAYQTGFESEFYFSRLFKLKVGLCPSEYRVLKVDLRD